MADLEQNVSPAEVLSTLHDGTGEFIGSAQVPWHCGICHALIFPNEVHKHPARQDGEPHTSRERFV